jgi:hypothetical protein
MQCPAVIIGRADAVLVEPTDGAASTETPAPAPDGVSTATVNDLQAQVVDDGTATGQLEATFGTAGVSATLSFQESDAAVQQILQSFRSAQ